MLSYPLWRSYFGGDRGVVGKTVTLDGKPARIVGVLPADFEMPTLERVDVLVPQGVDDAMLRRAVSGLPLRVIGRLKPGVSIEQARAALGPWLAATLASAPTQVRRELKLRVRTLRDLQVGDSRLASWILLGSVLAVLLISCANVASLLLARAIGRRRELAMRAALGAARGRLIRQTLTESVLLALSGGAAGIVLAHWLLKLFIALAPEGIPRLKEAALDGRVLLFAFGCALLSGVLFGLTPALENPRPESLTGWHSTRGGARGFLHQALVTAQIAISLVLVMSASLLARTLRNIENAHWGMQAGSVLTASLVLDREKYPDARRQLAFYKQLEDQLGRASGVGLAAISDSLPPDLPLRSKRLAGLEVAGRAPLPADGGTVVWRAVTPAYFSVLGIPLIRGRGFQEEDRRAGAHSIVLSQMLARRLFGSEDPIGQRIRTGEWFTVIGVAGDVKNSGSPGRDDPEYYVVRSHVLTDPAYNYPDELRRAALIVRSPMNPNALAQVVRSQIASIDPESTVTIETMRHHVGELAVRPRFNAALLGLFAAAGLTLAVVGLYGLVFFLVVQGKQEIGVRMALGATPAAILRLTLARALRWIGCGAIAGLAIWLALGRLLRSLLFGVSDNDSRTLAACLAVLLLVTLAAAFLPARKAAAVDPLVALREE